jgi:hypothetical protein
VAPHVERRLASLRAILMQSDAEIRAQYPEYFLTYYTYLRIIRNPARIEHVFQKAHDMYRYLESEGKDVLDLGAGFGIEAWSRSMERAGWSPPRSTATWSRSGGTSPSGWTRP